MLDVKRLVQFTLYGLVILSSSILGMSLGNPRLIVIALVGATIGFVVTDLLKIFRIEGLIANMASIVILVLAMKDFFPEDSSGKLVSVANLLVYLQTVLMFQEKTPRLNWQIMVLSLLQIVVGSIFSLKFEAGMLFFVYFFVVSSAMLLQSVYTVTTDIKRRNQKSAARLFPLSNDNSRINQGATSRSVPVTFFDASGSDRSSIPAMFMQQVLWIGVSLMFTVVMFYMIPRHTQSWFGPVSIKVKSAGVSKSVDLMETGVIPQSTQLIFRCEFHHIGREDEPGVFRGAPYFRGLALSDLVITDGITDWRAPHDRVHNSLYQSVRFSPGRFPSMIQIITLEETTDPLIYGVAPFYRSRNTPDELMFCHEISALTRCKINEKIGLAPYKYVAKTLVDQNGYFNKSWPYIANTRRYSNKPMSDDPPQHAWLTQMDASRYASVTSLSDTLAEQNRQESGSRLDLFRKMETYFYIPSEFRYTLDFRKIKRDPQLDPIEDFVRNHRSGHCELFASALTLMLRHQGIPARVVVGFRGGDYSQLTGSYLIRAKHAHAWVEAYLRPEDCSQEMIQQGQAGPGGAWMILDATPGSNGIMGDDSGDEAMDLARSVWDDYVLGMDGETDGNGSSFSFPLFEFFRKLDMDAIEAKFKSATESAASPRFIAGVSGLLLAIFLYWIRKRFQGAAKPGVNAKAGILRRMVANAISLISPSLAQWVMDGSRPANPTKFYQRMTDILEQQDLRRDPSQTHREFVTEVANQFESHPSANLIQSTVAEITELFNEVRFGRVELESELCEQIDMSLIELNQALTSGEINRR